ncbi:hypothetical protein FRB90_011019, partial [Tulasnella sp. 427]
MSASPSASTSASAQASSSSSSSASRAQPWKHLVAGGLGGMGGAIVTAPLDVVKTRLQSSIFHHEMVVQQKVGTAPLAAGVNGTATAEVVLKRSGGLLWNFVETGYILKDIAKHEGTSALFKGLGPSLVGVIPARSINFFTYGNGKLFIADKFNGGVETPLVHLAAAMSA